MDLKEEPLWFAMTMDQIGSRRAPDAVPAALAALSGSAFAWRLVPERTAGDEIQALTAEPGTVVAAVTALTRLGDWRIGIGCGEVEIPLPASTRAARGAAYIAARDAVEAARHTASAIAVRDAGEAVGNSVGAGEYGGTDSAAWRADTAMVLLRTVLDRRTAQGWEAIDLITQGLANRAAAARLAVSESAISQRLTRALYHEGRRAEQLAAALLGEVIAR